MDPAMQSTLILSVVPFGTALLIYGLKLVLPKLPKPLIPVLASVIGALGVSFLQLSQDGTINATLGALAGAGAVALDQIQSQTRKYMEESKTIELPKK